VARLPCFFFGAGLALRVLPDFFFGGIDSLPGNDMRVLV
jgi:hypothetical protein